MFFKYIFFTALPCVFASVVCSHIHKEICEFTDEACVTNAHKYLLKSIIGGNELWGLKCLDPVQTDTINVDLLQDMNYILTDAHLYGMNDCDGYKLKFDENFSWYFYLICPKLTLKADYVEKGVFESSPIEGKGRLVITYDNYHIITKGEIETVTGCDGKPHLNITEYKIEELDVKDDIALTFINICTNDLDKCISIAGKGLCDFNDELCVTKAEKSVFKTIVAGNQLWAMESSDPLRVPTININLSYNMDYTFTDVYLYGMTDCDNHKLKFDKDSSWYFYLICPRLILKADYIEKGSIDSVAVEGKGKITITYDTYHIVTKGAVETITGSDGKPHMNVTYFEIAELDAKGDVAFDFRNMCTNDLEKSEKAHEYINDNWKQMNDVIQYPIMQSVLIKFFNNLNKYLDAVPKYEIFYKDL